MRRSFLFLAILPGSLLCGADALAQQPRLTEGTRVRLVAASLATDQQIARIISMAADSVVFRSDTYPITRSLALNEIERIDVSYGRRRHAGQGALIGLAAGAAGGAAIGALTYNPCEGFCFLEPKSRGADAALGAGIGLLLGGVTGTIIGALHETEDWKPFLVKPTATVTGASGGRFGIQLTRRF